MKIRRKLIRTSGLTPPIREMKNFVYTPAIDTKFCLQICPSTRILIVQRRKKEQERRTKRTNVAYKVSLNSVPQTSLKLQYKVASRILQRHVPNSTTPLCWCTVVVRNSKFVCYSVAGYIRSSRCWCLSPDDKV